MNPVISLRGLRKTYPEFELGPLDLDLTPGSVTALIGPNGAGKTTTLHCLVGLLSADAITLHIDGRPTECANDWKRELGFVGEAHCFFNDWTGVRNLDFLAAFHPRWDGDRAAALAARFDLDLTRKVRTLSRGNRCKLGLVAALAHSPKILILDEPTTGLDPVVRSEFLDSLRELNADEERSILYSTHILSDIDRLADELVFLSDGKVFEQVDQTELSERWGRLVFHLNDPPPELASIVELKSDGARHMIITDNRAATVSRLREVGAGDIADLGLSVGEIAVWILKQARSARGVR